MIRGRSTRFSSYLKFISFVSKLLWNFIFTTDIDCDDNQSEKVAIPCRVSSAVEVKAIRFTKIFLLLFQSSYVKLSILNRCRSDADADVICKH